MTTPTEPPEGRPARWHSRDLELEDPWAYPTEEPRHPEVGAHWYDTVTRCLCVWDGAQWEPVPHD